MDGQMRGSGRVVAVIPARGGSKGVPRKNLRLVRGRSLIERAVQACRGVESIDEVVVSTDDPQIAAAAQLAGARCVDRPATLAGDAASSESALLHALGVLALGEPGDVLVFVQCTSPFIDCAAMASAIAMVRGGEFDSVFAARTSFDFVWRADATGSAIGVNHDHRGRLRRQDRTPDLVETGAFYVVRADGFLESGHRFFGRVGTAIVPDWTAIEIDEPEDLELAESLSAVYEVDADPFVDVDVLVTDFDGVHTDDRVTVRQDGSEAVVVSRSDGYGIDRLNETQVPTLILSREKNPVVAARAAKLGVECVHGVSDKWSLLRGWLEARSIDPTRVAYVGNDLNDLECLGQVGWPIAVADAHPEVKAAARLVLSRAGGSGAVREVCDLIRAAVERRESETERA